MSEMPPVGWVLIESQSPKLTVKCRLSEVRPDVQGFGGWNEVTRPRQPPITTYQAPPGLHMTLGLMLDGWIKPPASGTVQDQLDALMQMGGRGPGQTQSLAPNGEPPLLSVKSPGDAVPYQDLDWVIGDLQLGDGLMDKHGNRVRQAVTLTLFEHVPDVYLTEKSAANRVRKAVASTTPKPGAPSKHIVVKRKTQSVAGSADDPNAGEDLLTIAANELGDANRWTEIADLNDIRDPRSVVAGQVIALP